MYGLTSPYDTPDFFDSRDVDAKIEELTTHLDQSNPPDYEESIKELEALKEFRDEVGGSEWKYGMTFIRDDYFEIYAQELAEDIGAIDRDLDWPARHIDWVAAAKELRMDYHSYTLNGVEYWARA